MEPDLQPDMAEFFNFAAASMPEENGQLDVPIAFTSADVFDPVAATHTTHTCPVHPEGTEYALRPFDSRFRLLTFTIVVSAMV